MSKGGTQYFEGERELTHIHLSRYGINPHATQILIESYKKNVAPLPVKMVFEMEAGLKKVIRSPKDTMVELNLSTPGFLGKSKGHDTKPLSDFAVKFFIRSYYENLSPMPMSFIYDGVEIHLRTPSVSDNDKKNVARHVFNPLQEKLVSKNKKGKS